MSVHRIISGGQTGADRGGLEAAIGLGIPHGGSCPRGRRAEDGAIPARYGLVETESRSYSERTRKNVLDADGTVVFTKGLPRGGSLLTIKVARSLEKPHLEVDLARVSRGEAARRIRDWIRHEKISTLNVAGSRESQAPGLQKEVREVLERALGDSPP
jgi:hypothetical protein